MCGSAIPSDAFDSSVTADVLRATASANSVGKTNHLATANVFSATTANVLRPVVSALAIVRPPVVNRAAKLGSAAATARLGAIAAVSLFCAQLEMTAWPVANAAV